MSSKGRGHRGDRMYVSILASEKYVLPVVCTSSVFHTAGLSAGKEDPHLVRRETNSLSELIE
jgi:hypothetical protein